MKTIAFLACAIVLAFTSCASPLQRRLERNPALFAKLSESHRASILAGRVEEGMTKDAVFLAWGRPSRVTGGKRAGQSFERWNYTGYEAVQSYDSGFGLGMGYQGISHSRHGRDRYACNTYDSFYYRSVPQVDYVPFDAKMVEFTGGVVSAYAMPR